MKPPNQNLNNFSKSGVCSLLLGDRVERDDEAFQGSVQHSDKTGDGRIQAAQSLRNQNLFRGQLRQLLDRSSINGGAVNKTRFDLKSLVLLCKRRQNLCTGYIVVAAVSNCGGAFQYMIQALNPCVFPTR